MLPRLAVWGSARVMFLAACCFFFLSISLPRPISSTTLFGSAVPIASTELASHCWNGFATKYPSDVNQRVNEADTLVSTTGAVGAFCVRIVSSYLGSYFLGVADAIVI